MNVIKLNISLGFCHPSLLHSWILLVPLVHLLLLVASIVGSAVPLIELGLLGLPEHLKFAFLKGSVVQWSDAKVAIFWTPTSALRSTSDAESRLRSFFFVSGFEEEDDIARKHNEDSPKTLHIKTYETFWVVYFCIGAFWYRVLHVTNRIIFLHNNIVIIRNFRALKTQNLKPDCKWGIYVLKHPVVMTLCFLQLREPQFGAKYSHSTTLANIYTLETQ